MSNSQDSPQDRVLHPVFAVTVTRVREFIRQPEAVFWVYVFPLLMIFVLGLAFRSQGPAPLEIDLVDSAGAEQVKQWLAADSDVTWKEVSGEESRRRLRTGQSLLAVKLQDTAAGRIEYLFAPDRPEARALRNEIDQRLQRAAGRSDSLATTDQHVQESGGRYIDFLVPGLIGMGLMGGGLWGVGFAIVDLRIRKLLKRFLATPMRPADFLAGIMISRMLFMVPEILLMFLFSWMLFGVSIHGSWLLLTGLVLLGAVQFSGIGLLVASRCKTLEAASGLMNLVMLPMWTLCGIFFSWKKFPEVLHPLIQLLPLTPLIDSLRGVVNDGAGIDELWPQVLLIVGWALTSFVIALSIFRWRDN